jgi:succinate--hydroxymethylglutarate CoA-transferase
VNLKSPKGIEIMKKMALESDVVVHNFVPGKIEAMGLFGRTMSV